MIDEVRNLTESELTRLARASEVIPDLYEEIENFRKYKSYRDDVKTLTEDEMLALVGRLERVKAEEWEIRFRGNWGRSTVIYEFPFGGKIAASVYGWLGDRDFTNVDNIISDVKKSTTAFPEPGSELYLIRPKYDAINIDEMGGLSGGNNVRDRLVAYGFPKTLETDARIVAMMCAKYHELADLNIKRESETRQNFGENFESWLRENVGDE